MVALILAAGIPLIVMASTIAWQNYDFAFRQAREQARMIRAAAVARHEEAVGGARQMVGALARVPVVIAAVTHQGSGTDQDAGPAAVSCGTLMQDVRTLFPARFVAIGVTSSAGRVICQAADPAAATVNWVADAEALPWYAAMMASAKSGIGPLLAGGPDPNAPGTNIQRLPLLPIATPIITDGRVAGAVLTLARVDWLNRVVRGQGQLAPAWLIDGAEQLVDTAPPGRARPDEAALPDAAAFAQLARRDIVMTAASRGGTTYAYASTELADGLRLLIGTEVTNGAAAAGHTLFTRIAALGVLMLLGMAAVAAGAQHAIVTPARRLEGAVRRWRSGGIFDAGLRERLPTELRDLAASFAEASEALQERELQLRRALAQQELLMQEIHHRVKNNLQIIASLLNLQSSRIRLPQARAEFQSARDRVRSLATLHRYLYSHGEVHTINMRSFLAELCGQLFEAMGETEGERITLDIDAPELRMLSDQAVPLSLIVTEVVGNALKYAFPDGRSGRIGIRLTANEETAELVIEDDGVGMSPAAGDAAASLEEAGGGGAAAPGIGMQLIRGFVRQLRANLEIDESHGTRYRLHLPLHRDRAVSDTPEGSPAAPVMEATARAGD